MQSYQTLEQHTTASRNMSAQSLLPQLQLSAEPVQDRHSNTLICSSQLCQCGGNYDKKIIQQWLAEIDLTEWMAIRYLSFKFPNGPLERYEYCLAWNEIFWGNNILGKTASPINDAESLQGINSSAIRYPCWISQLSTNGISYEYSRHILDSGRSSGGNSLQGIRSVFSFFQSHSSVELSLCMLQLCPW